MPLSIADLILGVFVPAFVSAAVTASGRRWMRLASSNGWMECVAIAFAFWLGQALVSLAPLRPTSHWHWLPYVVLAAGVVSASVNYAGTPWYWRVVSYAASSGAAALMLVPAWSDLYPSRPVYIPIWTVAVVVIATLLERVWKHVSAATIVVTMMFTFTAAAVLLVLSGNLRFAQMSLAGAGAYGGMAVALSIRRAPVSLPSLAFLSTTALASLMLVGQVNSFSAIPWFCYVLLPVSPLLGFRGTSRPFLIARDTANAVIPIATVSVALICILVIAWLAE